MCRRLMVPSQAPRMGGSMCFITCRSRRHRWVNMNLISVSMDAWAHSLPPHLAQARSACPASLGQSCGGVSPTVMSRGELATFCIVAFVASMVWAACCTFHDFRTCTAVHHRVHCTRPPTPPTTRESAALPDKIQTATHVAPAIAERKCPRLSHGLVKDGAHHNRIEPL